MLQGEHSAKLSTSIKLPFSIKTLVLSIFKWPLKTGFTVCINSLRAVFFFHAFVVDCWLFSKMTFSKNSFRNTIRVSKGWDPDQDRHSVGPDLGPNCLQRLSADNKVATSKDEFISEMFLFAYA